MEEYSELSKIQGMIYEIRGQKVMFDSDLATLYEVEVKYLNRTVKRNINRFPADFMFQLSQDEWDIFRSQNVIAKMATQDEGDNLRCHFGTANQHISKVRFLPHVFTEQGIAMLSGLLRSDIAIEVNIQIMRAFVQLRHYVLGKPDTNAQIADLRKLLLLYIEKNDKRVNEIIIALNNLLDKPKPTKQIGFNAK